MINLIKLSIIVLLLDSIFLYGIKDLFSKQIFKVQNSDLQLNLTGAILAYIFIILSFLRDGPSSRTNDANMFVITCLLLMLIHEYSHIHIAESEI